MTNERAIEILDPEHREHYDSIETVNEACRIGMRAIKELAELKAKSPLKILESFKNALTYEIIKGDGDEEDAFTRGYNCACDSHVETIQRVFEREVKKYYES